MLIQEEHDIEQLQERERAVRQLESDILDVNTIFKVFFFGFLVGFGSYKGRFFSEHGSVVLGFMYSRFKNGKMIRIGHST